MIKLRPETIAIRGSSYCKTKTAVKGGRQECKPLARYEDQEQKEDENQVKETGTRMETRKIKSRIMRMRKNVADER